MGSGYPRNTESISFRFCVSVQTTPRLVLSIHNQHIVVAKFKKRVDRIGLLLCLHP